MRCPAAAPSHTVLDDERSVVYVRNKRRKAGGPRLLVFAHTRAAYDRCPHHVRPSDAGTIALLLRGVHRVTFDVPRARQRPNPPSAAAPFVEYFRLHERGRSGGIRVGKRWLGDGDIRDATEKGMVIASEEQRMRTLSILAVFRTTPDNVLCVFAAESRGTHVFTYSPWCAAGSLGRGCRRFALSDRAAILRGVWKGLRILHEDMNILHFDVKDNNIFVDVRAGGYVGVIGDVDDVLLRSRCHTGVSYTYTPCYGSPFHMCDPRRDQVAMLLTTIMSLTGVDWNTTCAEQFGRSPQSDITKWGFASGGTELPGEWEGWVRGVYTAYAERLRRATGGQSATAVVLNDPVWLKLLAVLDGDNFRVHWWYDDIHSEIMRALGRLQGSLTTQ